MGANWFTCTGREKTAAEAFRNATESARFEYGHSGYTGSIAEKHTFKVIQPRKDETPMQCVDRHEHQDDLDDKWGPAGCIDLGNGKFLFFGWAAS